MVHGNIFIDAKSERRDLTMLQHIRDPHNPGRNVTTSGYQGEGDTQVLRYMGKYH